MNSRLSKLRIGIVGGMGPAASNYFAAKLTELAPADKDQDHPTVIHLSDPSVPDRTGYLTADGDDPAPHIISSVKQLEFLSPHVICVPCNTAHAKPIFERVKKSIKTPIINMIEETVEELADDVFVRRVGLLATDGTVETGVYHQAAFGKNIDIVTPADESQAVLMKLIYKIKSKGHNARDAQILYEVAQSMNVDTLLVACTELSMLTPRLRKLNLKEKIVDSLEVLANRALEFGSQTSRTNALTTASKRV